MGKPAVLSGEICADRACSGRAPGIPRDPVDRQPCITTLCWHDDACGVTATLAIAAPEPARAQALAAAFGGDEPAAPCDAEEADAAIVDSPALLDHDVVRRLVAVRHPAASVVLGASEDVETSLAMIRAGAAALLPRDPTASELRETVACVLRGEAVVPPEIASAAVRRLWAAEHRG